MYYYHCAHCGFIFTSFCDDFDSREFKRLIYNENYHLFDPDYFEKRALANADFLMNLALAKELSILDFGCGNGKLVQVLSQKGYNIKGYDPYNELFIKKPKHNFDLIVSFEVLEHSPQPFESLKNILYLLKDDGLLLFSTLLIPQNINELGMNWWYIAPRNGHISLFSSQSLQKLLQRIDEKFILVHLNENLHLIYNVEKPSKLLQFNTT